MSVAVAGIGLGLVALGVLGIASPDRLVALVRRWQTPRGIWTIAGIRLAIGAALLLAAPVSRAPGYLTAFGALAIVSGVATPIFGVRLFRAVLDWSAGNLGAIRVWAVLVVVIGLSLIWSVAP